MDNIDRTCPARMMDGRHFTDYRPRCDVNHELQRVLGAEDSYSYRILLQRHAVDIMDAERRATLERMVCRPCDAKDLAPMSRMQPLRNLKD